MNWGWLVVYAPIGVLVGVIVGAESTFSESVPAGSGPALGVLGGLLWPLAALAGLGWVSWRASIALVDSFAALWDATLGAVLARRRARVRLPRAREVRR